MKSICVFLFAILLMDNAFTQDAASLWDIKFNTIDGFPFPMKLYKGKTTVLFTIDASDPDQNQLRIMDSVNNDASGKIGVVGILINDFGKAKKKELLLAALREGVGLSFPVTQVSGGRNEDKIANENLLLDWLNKSRGNPHFKIVYEEPGQVFIISPQCRLHAILSKSTLSVKEINRMVRNYKE